MALSDASMPCALASATTAMGFLSLLTATMEPVRELGVFAALGILLNFGVNFTVGPALLCWLKVPPRPEQANGMEHQLGKLSGFLGRHRFAATGLSAVLVLGGALGISTIRVESDPLTFLDEELKAVQDYELICSSLTGVYALELLIDNPEGWRSPESLGALEPIEHALHNLPGVAKVLGPGSGVEDERGLARESMSRFISSDGKTARLSVLINVMDSGRFSDILDVAEEALRDLPAPLRGGATGIVPRLVRAQLDLVSTQLLSFGLAFCIVFACILVGLRSFKLMLVSILPNMVPIGAAFSAMAIADVPLDAGTVMVASVALGIAVDDTVHLLAGFRRGLRGNGTPIEACRHALAHAGPAMIITTATACAGFFALARSAFVPIQWFGLLSGLAMVAALAADLLTVPALLMLLPWRRSVHDAS